MQGTQFCFTRLRIYDFYSRRSSVHMSIWLALKQKLTTAEICIYLFIVSEPHLQISSTVALVNLYYAN
jgi:hypothetical protein